MSVLVYGVFLPIAVVSLALFARWLIDQAIDRLLARSARRRFVQLTAVRAVFDDFGDENR